MTSPAGKLTFNLHPVLSGGGSNSSPRGASADSRQPSSTSRINHNGFFESDNSTLGLGASAPSSLSRGSISLTEFTERLPPFIPPDDIDLRSGTSGASSSSSAGLAAALPPPNSHTTSRDSSLGPEIEDSSLLRPELSLADLDRTLVSLSVILGTNNGITAQMRESINTASGNRLVTHGGQDGLTLRGLFRYFNAKEQNLLALNRQMTTQVQDLRMKLDQAKKKAKAVATRVKKLKENLVEAEMPESAAKVKIKQLQEQLKDKTAEFVKARLQNDTDKVEIRRLKKFFAADFDTEQIEQLQVQLKAKTAELEAAQSMNDEYAKKATELGITLTDEQLKARTAEFVAARLQNDKDQAELKALRKLKNKHNFSEKRNKMLTEKNRKLKEEFTELARRNQELRAENATLTMKNIARSTTKLDFTRPPAGAVSAAEAAAAAAAARTYVLDGGGGDDRDDRDDRSSSKRRR